MFVIVFCFVQAGRYFVTRCGLKQSVLLTLIDPAILADLAVKTAACSALNDLTCSSNADCLLAAGTCNLNPAVATAAMVAGAAGGGHGSPGGDHDRLLQFQGFFPLSASPPLL